MGADFDQGLMHWKYIKRYRSKDGKKWYYVYANKSTHQSITKDLQNQSKWLDTANYEKKKSDTLWNTYERANKYNVGDNKFREEIAQESMNYFNSYVDDKVNADNAYYSAYHKIKNNTVSRIKDEVVKTGRDTVKNLLNSAERLKNLLF